MDVPAHPLIIYTQYGGQARLIDLCQVAVASNRPALPVADRIRVGICGAKRSNAGGLGSTSEESEFREHAVFSANSGNRRQKLVQKSQTVWLSMISPGMSGNGSKIAGTRTIQGLRRTAPLGSKRAVGIAAAVWSVAGPGTTNRRTYVLRTGTGTKPTTGTTTLVSVLSSPPARCSVPRRTRADLFTERPGEAAGFHEPVSRPSARAGTPKRGPGVRRTGLVGSADGPAAALNQMATRLAFGDTQSKVIDVW